MNNNRSLRFATFITPQFGVVLFWLLGGAMAIVAAVSFFHGALTVGFGLLAGIVGLRVGFETLTVLFQIHDVLVDIRDQDDRKQLAARKLDEMQRARELAAKGPPVKPGEFRIDS